MVKPNRNMSIQPPPSCKGTGSTLPTGGYPSTLRLAGLCEVGLVGLYHRVRKVWWDVGAFPLPLWLVLVACLALACASVAHWEWRCLRRCRVSHLTRVGPVPLRGHARRIGGRWRMPRWHRLPIRRDWEYPLNRKRFREGGPY